MFFLLLENEILFEIKENNIKEERKCLNCKECVKTMCNENKKNSNNFKFRFFAKIIYEIKYNW